MSRALRRAAHARIMVGEVRPPGRAAGLVDLTAPAPEVVRQAVHGAAGLRRTHGAERRAVNEIVLRLPDGSLRLGLRDYADAHAAQADIFRRAPAGAPAAPDPTRTRC